MVYKKDEKKIAERNLTIEIIKQKYKYLEPHLNERSIRLYAAAEALSLGYKGIETVSKATGLSRTTISMGCKELNNEQVTQDIEPERIRKPGAGRKSLVEHNPEILEALKRLVDPTTFGDPENPLQWTIKSQKTLSDELTAQGLKISHTTVGSLLEEQGYSLQSNKKSFEGANNADRNAQFEYINKKVTEFMKQGQPVISVDAKKKEQIGNFKNSGKTYRKKHDPELVNVYDFPSLSSGKAIPYGVYDIAENIGWVNVGIDHNTAAFAVESIRRWYKKVGIYRYPNCDKILITADSGSSNGIKNRLWKTELQKLANELKLPIHVCHFPPGTSKWNKVEHRLFSYISKNWQGKPLVSYQVMLQFISATTTATGLEVYCEIDDGKYETGIKITDDEIAKVNMLKDEFHGEWNYIIENNIEPEKVD